MLGSKVFARCSPTWPSSPHGHTAEVETLFDPPTLRVRPTVASREPATSSLVMV